MGRSLIPARAPHTVTREVDGGFVVLDRDHALALEGDYATVWAAAGTTADVDTAALDELTELGLLDAPGVSRRSMLRRTGAVAAGVGIASIVLPMASAAASVAPTVTLTPSSGPKGTVVGVSGSGFPANTLIQITFNGTPVTVSPGGVLTDGSGNIPAGVTFTVPSTANVGGNTVAVVVGLTSKTATFTVTQPSVTISTTGFVKGAGPGTVTIVSSSGFLPSSNPLTISGTGGYTNVSPTSGTISATGTIATPTSVTVTYGNGSKSGNIVFTDAAGNTVSVALPSL